MLKCFFTIVLLESNRIFDSTNKTNDMTLTAKEVATLELLNKKGLVYEYVEVEALCIGGTKLVNKLVKIDAKAKKVDPVMKMVAESKEMTSVEAQEVMEASRKRQMKNL